MIPAEQLFAVPPGPEQIEEFLMACHRGIEARLAALERAAEAMQQRPAEALEAFDSVFRFLDSSGTLHTEDEEDSLFPRLRARMERGEHAFLAGLEHDHAEAGMLARRLRSLVEQARHGAADAAAIRGAAGELAALYRRHIAVEDSALASYSRQLLTPPERLAIASEMRKRRNLPAHASSADPLPENRP